MADTSTQSPTKRTVVISEPHPFRKDACFGGHQYAHVFARHGWRVIVLSASFNIWRVMLPRPAIDREYMQLWREHGRRIGTNITNYCLSHWLPRRLRYVRGLGQLSAHLYVPRVASVIADHGIHQADLLWLNGNQDWLLRKVIPHRKLLVRIIDDYSGFGDTYDNHHPMMMDTLRRADAIFACSRKVRELYKASIDDIEIAPNGVDIGRFAAPAQGEPEALRNIPRPRITYVGAVAEWFDWDLVVALARRLPAHSFVICGKWSRQRPDKATCPQNIYVLGPIEYDQVPAVLAHSDVGLIPFRDTELVRGVSPIKAYEYLAARLPVVSLRWRALEDEALPFYLAQGVNEFEKGIKASLSLSDEERAVLARSVRACSWEQRLRTMLAKIDVTLEAASVSAGASEVVCGR